MGTRRKARADKLKIGDEVNVVVRSRVAEYHRGGEIAYLDLHELYHQGRVDRPVIIAMPVDQIRSRKAPKSDGMPAIGQAT